MRRTAFLVILLWLSAVVLLAPGVDTYNHAFLAERSTGDMPLFVRILGEGTSILSNLSLLQADLYFHGGVGHFEEEHEHGPAIFEVGTGTHEHEEEGEGEEKVPLNRYNILLRVSDGLHVTEHVHLQGEDAKEILPWLYYAARIDPHNVLAYTLTFYWVADVLGKADEGLAFLKKGLKNNPDSWEINAELGRCYFKFYKDYDKSARYLSRAHELMQDEPHDKFQERYVLSFLALSYEELGRDDEARPLYERLNALFPDNETFKKRLRI